jgi:hypothetical protein
MLDTKNTIEIIVHRIAQNGLSNGFVIKLNTEEGSLLKPPKIVRIDNKHKTPLVILIICITTFITLFSYETTLQSLLKVVINITHNTIIISVNMNKPNPDVARPS